MLRRIPTLWLTQHFALTAAILVGTVIASSTVELRADEPLEAAKQRLAGDLTFLASDELAGRGVGSEGIAQAGEYIAQRFRELGFQTDAFDGTPFQNFGIPGTVGLGDPQRNKLVLEVQGQAIEGLSIGKDFTPLSLGQSGEFSGQVVFAGYGITADDFKYDDFAGLDVQGKVVIVLRKEPQQDDPQSVFDGTQNSQYALFTIKEMNAATHKAAAVLIVNDAKTVRLAAAKLEEDLKVAQASLDQLRSSPAPADDAQKTQRETRLRIAQQTVDALKTKIENQAGEVAMTVDAAGVPATNDAVPTVYITRKLADQLIQAGCRKSLADLEKTIDETGKPSSVVLEGVQARGQVELKKNDTPVRNVIAVLPGAGDLKDEYVVVGAHYDHVGMGGMGSLAPGTVAVHNGADDNGSGTVTMLEVARQLSSLKSANRRSVIFMAFTAEESGLLGSAHYVRNPRWPLEKTVAMINLDMVGRLLNDELTIYGTGTASEFPAIIDHLNETYKFKVVKVPQGRGASDHSSFYDAKIPVFHFFTGLHNEYHRPSDDVNLINVDGLVRISQLVTDLARQIVETPQKPTYQEIRGSAAPRNQSGAGKAMIGIRLDRQPEAPVAVQGLVDGGPAATAGLQVGDVLVSINKNPINNIGEFRSEMAKLKAGQTISVGFRRGQETQTVDVKLGE